MAVDFVYKEKYLDDIVCISIVICGFILLYFDLHPTWVKAIIASAVSYAFGRNRPRREIENPIKPPNEKEGGI